MGATSLSHVSNCQNDRVKKMTILQEKKKKNHKAGGLYQNIIILKILYAGGICIIN